MTDEELTDRAADMILDLAEMQRSGLRLPVAAEVEPDGYLVVTFLDRNETYPFKTLKGWHVFDGWLRIVLVDRTMVFPYHRVANVECVYNSPEVAAQIKNKDHFHCPKCGGNL